MPPYSVAERDEADRRFMQRALALATRAEGQAEVPVGAVLVLDGELVAEGWNQVITSRDPTAHAEIVAMRAAARYLGNYRLPRTTLYVTLEPCSMCVGAIIHARVSRLAFGAHDAKTGAAGSVFDLIGAPAHNHRVAVNGGILAEDCAEVLQRFFRRRRKTSRGGLP
jgi:tRNA(adenine34) deaminase